MTPGQPDPHGTQTHPAIDLADPVDEKTRSAGVAAETCPSCDSPGAWTISKRHRFNPFAGVLAMVVAFWSLVFGLALRFTLLPAALLVAAGVLIIVAQRTALVCQVCGFVKPRS